MGEIVMATWNDIKYFKEVEFEQKGLAGSGNGMDMEFVAALDVLRGELGRPIVITSGYRTAEYNKGVGGSSDSAHIRGLAADIKCIDSGTRAQIILAWLKMGHLVTRIGIGNTFVHLDLDPKLPNNVIWTY